MFGYVRPYHSQLLVQEYQQYKAVYCQLCRCLGEEYGWLARFSLSYDCTFYAMLSLSVSGARLQESKGLCAMNPLKRCIYLRADGESYQKASALTVLLTYHKLRDDVQDDGFWKSLGKRLLLPFAARKARKAAGRYPFLARAAEKAMAGQREAEQSQAGLDPCAEPTARLLADVFQELAGCDKGQATVLERFGYFLGRWVYLMDAADDLQEDLRTGAFNPFIRRLGLEGERGLDPARRSQTDQACNAVLNATAAQMLLPLNLLKLGDFGPIIENVVRKGLPELQREILFLHIREKPPREMGDL